jgi:signal transduction histidine kinase
MEDDLIARDDEIRNKNEELLLSKKLASLGTLASGVAHELNNPLNNVYLAAQTLSRKIDYEACPGIIDDSIVDIFTQTHRMKRIVNDLLEYSRQGIPEPELINIVDSIKDIFQRMKANGVMADVEYNVTGDEDIKVHADSGLLEQVFINLCGNAVDAMEGHGTIEITINRVETCLQIKVTDTGKGIPSEDIPQIFDPFFTKKEKGTGLGLAIVYSIIERHNGKIEVKSEPDKGTTFIITLPGE